MDQAHGLKVGDKVEWSRAASNNIEGPLEIVDIKVLSDEYAQATLKSGKGRIYRQTILPESLWLAK